MRSSAGPGCPRHPSRLICGDLSDTAQLHGRAPPRIREMILRVPITACKPESALPSATDRIWRSKTFDSCLASNATCKPHSPEKPLNSKARLKTMRQSNRLICMSTKSGHKNFAAHCPAAKAAGQRALHDRTSWSGGARVQADFAVHILSRYRSCFPSLVGISFCSLSKNYVSPLRCLSRFLGE